MRAARELPQDHHLVLVTTLLAGGVIDECARARARRRGAVLDLLPSLGNITDRVAPMSRSKATDDGERLFLLANRVGVGRDTLLAWVRTGNRERVWHAMRTKGELSLRTRPRTSSRGFRSAASWPPPSVIRSSPRPSTRSCSNT